MKKIRSGIFIDDANLFHGQKKAGWKVNIPLLIQILKKEVDIIFTHYHICLPLSSDPALKQSLIHLNQAKKFASVITKPLKYIHTDTGIIKKGDVDLELAVDIIQNIDLIDLFIIVSGDSDYVVLRNYLLSKNKKVIFISFKHTMAWELRKGKYLLFDRLKPWVQSNIKKTPRPKPRRLLQDLL